MKKNTLCFLVEIVLILSVTAIGGYFWYQNSPYQTYFAFSKSISDKNLDEAEKYINFNKIAENFQKDISSSVDINDTNQGDVTGLVDDMKDSFKKGKFLSDKNLAKNQYEAFSNGVLTRDGENFELKDLKLGTTSDAEANPPATDIYFTKTGSGWKATKLKINFTALFGDTSSGQSSSQSSSKETVEKNLNEEFQIPDYNFKATGVELKSILETTIFSGEKITVKPVDENNQFAIVEYQVTNTSNEPGYFSTLNMKIEVDGIKSYAKVYQDNLYQFEIIEPKDIPEGFQDLFRAGSINPDGKAVGKIAIEIPKISTKDQLKLIIDSYDPAQKSVFKVKLV